MRRVFLIIGLTFCMGASLAGFAQAAEDSGEPTWWERCEELPRDQIEACFREHNGEGEREERPPTKPTTPLRAYIGRHFPASHSLFANCPAANTVGERGLACEFRFLQRGHVVKGRAAVEAEGDNLQRSAWWLVGFHAQAPAPRRWRRCATRRPSLAAPEPVRLSVRGVPCKEAGELGLRIGYFDVSARTLRLPHHFSEGEYQTNTLGFVVARYHCRGKVEVRQGNPNPYGHETAVCHTRFGDRLTYIFNRGS